MSITAKVNQAKDDLDHIQGEVARLFELLPVNIPNEREILNSLDIIAANARHIRASL